MNRLVYSALAIFCFAIVSCTDVASISDYDQDHIVLNVFNSPMTKAEGNSSTDYERQLNRLDCFFYVKDQTDQPCVYYHKADVNELGSATISFIVNDLVLKDIFPSGSLCDVLVIANLPGNHTFEANSPETTMPRLGEFVLDMTNSEYDGVGKPFVMTGFSRVQKGNNSNASANISLVRVASKVTVTVKVPKEIEIKVGEENITMVPVLADSEGNEPLKTSFRYGTNKSYLSGAYPDSSSNYIHTKKIPYTLSEERTTESHYVFTCDMPFYTYARSWEKGADNAAYVTFEMPWAVKSNEDNTESTNSYQTYYYQILINGKERNFTPNTYYDLIVTVGVLGSTIEALPETLDELSYYVLDWTSENTNGEVESGDRDEDVEIDKFNYLEVPQKYIEMNNVSEATIHYDASHKIGVKFDTKGGKTVEGLPNTTNYSALYINNGSGKPAAVEITDIDIEDNFTDNGRGSLTFNYTLSDGVYSPAYVFITIWLDLDGDGVHDLDDEVLTQDVTIVLYPAIYIIGDNSATYSVFVNGNYRQAGQNSDYATIAGEEVGRAAGTDPDNSTYMHVITISAFNSKDDNHMFVYRNNEKKEYIIGDPRERTPNKLTVPDDTEEVKHDADGWIKATDVNGVVRNLQYYYPTATEDSSYQVIAPKFRIASKLGGYSSCSPKGAARRCASYQEHGFPAGRWRLPTTAEMLYIIELQRLGKIQKLFYGNKYYFSATDRVQTDNSNGYSLHTDPGLGSSNASVRCVYDEWYWGSKREAIRNAEYDNSGGYQFTWGDREIY